MHTIQLLLFFNYYKKDKNVVYLIIIVYINIVEG